MNDTQLRDLCLSLLFCDTENDVIQILRKHGFWDAPNLWRYYGDTEGNFSTIGNQQSRAEAALVEKAVNSVDAVLMNACWLNGISPEDPNAPKTIHEAVALYFGNSKNIETAGYIQNWDNKKRTELSRLITLAATGMRADSDSSINPCFTITDAGEGQTPNSIPLTLLSLDKKNKQKIQFVQGKFNMGGTGVLQFCGHHNLELVISRRNPKIAQKAISDDSRNMWGFTIVRREDPLPGEKSSVYSYLAPLGSELVPRKGGVLRFRADSLPIFPVNNKPYQRTTAWGTTIKLYEYHATGFRTMMLRKDGLLSRLDILLPELALPIRLHECRDYKGHTGSYEETLNGLTVRLEDNKANNLEDNFPTTCPIKVHGEQMIAKIYAFKKDKAETYRKNEGIIFTVNGQTHANLSTNFFNRKSVGMGRLDDSILVTVDCSNMSRRAQEDLFMNSRDRLRNPELRHVIEHELEDMLKNHEGLRELREKRRREEIESKVKDSKPLEETLKLILKSSPSLSSLFLAGTKLSNPFKTEGVSAKDLPYKGNLHPTYFKFKGLDYGQELQRVTAINMRCRIIFETDVVNDYFYRPENKGKFYLQMVNGSSINEVNNYILNLQTGRAILSLKLPENSSVGDRIEYDAKVMDDTLVNPFVNKFIVTVGSPQQTEGGSGEKANPPTEKKGKEREFPTGITLPDIKEVYESKEGYPKWEDRKHKFDKYSALDIIQEEAATNGNPSVYSFGVNMDNVYFKTECKHSKEDVAILKAKWLFGLSIIGMALIQADAKAENIKDKEILQEQSHENELTTLEERVFEASAAIAPVLLPLIESLGTLTEEHVMTGSIPGDDQ